MLTVFFDEVEILAAEAIDLFGRLFVALVDGRVDPLVAALEERLATDLADVVGGDVLVLLCVVVLDVAAEVAATADTASWLTATVDERRRRWGSGRARSAR